MAIPNLLASSASPHTAGSNQLAAMLDAWKKSKPETSWVLGVVYATEGSAYRKAGAMMMVNDLGQQYGLLSGGCLEADIIRRARKVMQTRITETLTYDGTDEDDLSFQLGIGCGGTVHIVLQPVTGRINDALGELQQALSQRQPGEFHLSLDSTNARFQPQRSSDKPLKADQLGRVVSLNGERWLVSPIVPPPHLLIVGGGMDAKPVAAMAHLLGWQVSITDPRAANARREHFPQATHILKTLEAPLAEFVQAERVDVAILMSHNLNLDAQALATLATTPLGFAQSLGPRHRFEEVLSRAGITARQLPFPVANPAGLDIGGQLPESIALSMLAEIHQWYFNKDRRFCTAPLAEAI
ncbi:XdhC family protein [Pokkaliibacter sp. CJK22405]|uniref:XdhC family protein n=1 Tax=Pokkaliibacter sp. CJK22405 TaxID=3384615 RepID=UPI003984ED0D